MAYRYVAYNATGEVLKGRVEAPSEEAAEAALTRSELAVIKLRKEYQRPSLEKALPSLFAVKRQDLVPFTRDLAALLEAGVPFYTALTTLRDRTAKTAFKRVLSQIVAEVEAGNSFSQALSHYPSVFPPIYLRLAKIGEEIGNLKLVLDQLTKHLEQELAVAAKIKRATGYPLFVMAVGIVAVFIVVSFVLPNVSRLFEEFGGKLPLATRMMMAAGSFLQDNVIYIASGVIALVAAVGLYLRTTGGKVRKDQALVKLPVAKKVTQYSNISRLARTFSLLLGAGISLTETLDMVVQTTGNVVIKEALIGVKADVHMGQPLSKAVAPKQRPVFPPLFAEMLRIGEETGKLESNLATLANYYEQELGREIDRLTGMIEPALILGVGLMVGFIAISVIQPMYSIIGQMR